jgi:putative ATPase
MVVMEPDLVVDVAPEEAKRTVLLAFGVLMNRPKRRKQDSRQKLGPSLTMERIEQRLLLSKSQEEKDVIPLPKSPNNALETSFNDSHEAKDHKTVVKHVASPNTQGNMAINTMISPVNDNECGDYGDNGDNTDNSTATVIDTQILAKNKSDGDAPEKGKKSIYLLQAEELNKLKKMASIPIAHRMKPSSLNDYYGQDKLLGENGILANIIQSDNIPSFILWGPPGVGKTTLARIIATTTKNRFLELSGAEANAKKLKDVFLVVDHEFSLTGRRTILFLDEIHRFNKSVQDILLPVIERGKVTIIGATTENPSFALNNALLSRMHTFVMEPLTSESIEKILLKALYQLNKIRINVHKLHYLALKKDALKYICELSQGDSRIALNTLESIHAYLSTDKYNFEKEEVENKIQMSQSPGVINVSEDILRPLLSTRNFHQMYDRQGENHYDTISAFHKSIRGSDADAAIYYLVKMLSGGEDPLFIARRMIVIASEDIGLRDSSCLPFAIAVKDAIEFIGMPEGEIPLAHCAIKLARAPKSTKSYRALRNAQALIQENPDLAKLPIPMHLRNAPTQLMKDLGYGDTYKYNPKYKYGKVWQTYLPPEINGTKFVEPSHLGSIEDEAVDSEEYEKLKNSDTAYEKFKRYTKERLRNQYIKEQNEVLEKNDKDGNYTYDEFLSKEDQPEYFDGEEIDQYSDDPESTNNFDQTYDEFLDPDSQPEYYPAME